MAKQTLYFLSARLQLGVVLIIQISRLDHVLVTQTNAGMKFQSAETPVVLALVSKYADKMTGHQQKPANPENIYYEAYLPREELDNALFDLLCDHLYHFLLAADEDPSAITTKFVNNKADLAAEGIISGLNARDHAPASQN